MLLYVHAAVVKTDRPRIGAWQHELVLNSLVPVSRCLPVEICTVAQRCSKRGLLAAAHLLVCGTFLRGALLLPSATLPWLNVDRYWYTII